MMLNLKWNHEELRDSLSEFQSLYNERPIKDNTGGMKSAHMFPSWFAIKKLRPKLLIESGVWRGLGTWFFRQASPDSHIVCIDPSPKFRLLTDSRAEYRTEDFLAINWDKYDTSDSLVFFDDHQNCLPRLKRCLELGFGKVMVEDNYPPSQGDCYTPKKILSQDRYVIDAAGQRFYYDSAPDDYRWMADHIKVYQEMPPLFSSERTRWGTPWGIDHTPAPLLQPTDIEPYRLFYEERLDYTWICYIELNL